MFVGDIKLDFYFGRDFCEDYWTNVIVGVVFPTGKRICDPGLLLAQPTGNNGHFELKGGIEGGWRGHSRNCEWLGIDFDVLYNYVFSRCERRGAPFTGATVKNIGPAIDADVKWSYLTAHLNLTAFHPENLNLGCTLSYEGYVKFCDKITLCQKTAQEFPLRAGCALTGTILNEDFKELDACILAADTKRIAHKVRCEIFHRWDYCELFAGGSYVFAGQNIMKETEAHIGLGIYW